MNKIIKGLLIINIIVFIISFAISFVILFRPFYYYHIDYLNLEKETGYTYNEIKEAYDDVIDYTTLNKPFKTGSFKYSSDGYKHFRDCKILFYINFILLGISSIVLFLKKLKFNDIKIKGYNISFYSSISIILLFITIILSYLILGFKRCFNLFHKIFFLGKDNWILDPDTDPIIDILPNEYFLDCAILVISIILMISIGIMIREIIIKRKEKKV